MKKIYYVAVLALSLSLFGCGGGGGGGEAPTPTPTPPPTDPGDTTAPSVSTKSPVTRLITTSSSITLKFDESIDTTSFTLSGSLVDESDGGVWSQTDVIDDTLTITPTTNWSANTERTLVINAKDLAGNPMAELTITHDVYRGTLYYISTAMPDDTGNGETPATARKFIHATVADVTAPATILVAEGEYRLSSAAIHQTQVVLKEGVSLYGGYNADFTQRDPASFISRIEDRSTDTGTFSSPNRAIEGNATITVLTIIDGFTIVGSTQAGSEYNSGISLYGSSPTVQNNTINGGSGDSASYGMYNSDGFPTVQHNTLNGGSGGINSYAMYNDEASPTVQNNTLNGGSGGINSYALYSADASPTVQHNTLNGGSGGNNSYAMYNLFGSSTVQNNTLNGGSGASSYGMYNISASPSVQNNTLNGGSGVDSSCGMYNDFASPTMQHNTFNGGSGNSSYGMYNLGASPSVQNNTIHGGSGISSHGMDNEDSVLTTMRNNMIHGGSGGIQTFGMRNVFSTLVLQNNIIYGGDDSDESRGIQSTSTELILLNNTIHGGGGIDESWAIGNFSTAINLDNNILIAEVSDSSICYVDYSSAPDSMQNNNFVGCEFTYRRSVVGPPAGLEWFSTIEEVNALTGASNNIAVDPLFVDQAGGDYHFSASSPTSVTAGGLNGIDDGWGFSDDKDGVTRPAGGSAWAIGAYEPN